MSRISKRAMIKEEFMAGEIDSGSAFSLLREDTRMSERTAEKTIWEWHEEKKARAKKDEPSVSGVPGRYHLQVFDTNARRMAHHHCDGTYDAINDLIRASQTAITDEAVSSVLMRDTENVSTWGKRKQGMRSHG